MFLLPNQQLERCDRVMQQRVKPHIHTTLAACTLRSFHNPGEPVPSSEFLAKVRNGQVPFEPFRVPGVWGTTWGTTWFEVNGHIDMAAVKGRKVELMVDLGWLDHRIPIRGTCLSCRRHRHQIREPTQPLDSTRLRGRQQHRRTR